MVLNEYKYNCKTWFLQHKDPPESLPAGPCSYEKEENEGVEEDWNAPIKFGARQVELLTVRAGRDHNAYRG